ncbi:MAG TPA: TRAP transporter large permease subunit, partial [Myxococcales bacterium]|nr:TRAP transporter large permease subunit [Myxococcales bacterium]
MSTAPATHDPNAADSAPQGTRVERTLVALLLLAMIALPAASSLMRRLLGREFPGASQLAQHMTLWVGFLGALLSTLTGRHLGLSTLDVIPAGWPRRAAAFLGQAVSAATCALLALASYRLVQAQWQGLARVAFGIREAWSELVMPVGFAIMALRFSWRADVSGPRSPWLRVAALLVAALAFLLGRTAPGTFLVTLLLVIVLAAFLAGAPVFVVMAGVAMALFFKDGTPLAAAPTAIFNLSKETMLPAIPLLTAAGYVLAEGDASRRLVRVYKGIFGWMPGGVAVMATVVCALFTTFTGASGVTILALGGLLLPSLVEDRYPEGFSVGLVTASGSLGLLFPPSLPVILYGVMAQAPIKHLFIGGLVPGLLMILLVAGYGVMVGV